MGRGKRGGGRGGATLSFEIICGGFWGFFGGFRAGALKPLAIYRLQLQKLVKGLALLCKELIELSTQTRVLHCQT
jgi:hypothetical protein